MPTLFTGYLGRLDPLKATFFAVFSFLRILLSQNLLSNQIHESVFCGLARGV
jgi:hypothetical protein